jgi:hypothetical protein
MESAAPTPSQSSRGKLARGILRALFTTSPNEDTKVVVTDEGEVEVTPAEEPIAAEAEPGHEPAQAQASAGHEDEP